MPLFDKLAPRLLGHASDEQYSSLEFLYHHRRLPNLRNPQTLSEKMLWLKLNYRDSLIPQCTDKLLVRDYVRATASEEFLVPLIEVFEKAETIPFSSLPDQFILKATHGSGWNVMCRSRDSFDEAGAIRTLSRFLNSNFYFCGREWNYRSIRPRIICEELLLDEKGEVPEDYKFFCFNGQPGLVEVDYDRFQGHKRNLYDRHWNQLPCTYGYPNNLQAPPCPPALLDEMLEVARCLSSPFPFVRVDMYALGTRIFVGELSFFPGRSVRQFRPILYDSILGEALDLGSLVH